MKCGLFVTGTDTGVGKTLISCGILHLARSCGMEPAAMKPVATGDREDARKLIKAAGLREKLDLVNPVFFRDPLAPAAAAARENSFVDLDRIYRAFWILAKTYPFVVVEGVGGIRVPLGDNTFVTDLARALRLPVLIVARAGLGTINHTLLTVEHLEKERIPIFGILLNRGGGKTADLAEATNPTVLRSYVSVPVYGPVRQDPLYRRQPARLGRDLARIPGFQEGMKKLCRTS